MPIALLLQLAAAIPGLMKYVGAGDTSVKIANAAVDLAKTVTGETDSQQAVTSIIADPIKRNEYALKVNEQMIEWDKLYINDIADARARDVELRKLGDPNNRANWMITLDAVGLLACLFVLVFYQKELPEGVLTLITTIASIFGLCLRDAHQFEFGSSRASKDKDSTISQLARS